MKKNPVLIGCILVPILAMIAFYIGFKSVKKTDSMSFRSLPKSDIWLDLSLTGDIYEYAELTDALGREGLSVESICRKIRTAATDKAVKGIILRPHFIQMTMAGLNEIGLAFNEFKSTGKPIIAFLEFNEQKDYLLSTYANKIAMEPAASAGLLLNGVEANITFYKKMLDKLGLKVNVIRSGQFKGYGEQYTQNSLSEGTLENTKRVLKERYDLIIKHITKQRNLSEEKVKEIFEQRPDFVISAEYAKSKGLIDIVSSKEALFKLYNIKDKQILKITNYSSYQSDLMLNKEIAVIYLQGNIISDPLDQMGMGIDCQKLENIITYLKKDNKTKAIVLRINSPGGSALESEKIYRLIQIAKREFPIVVSMAGVAASGGYYISAGADYIVADPYSITGSIGVIQLVPDASGLGNKIGLNQQNIAFGKYAGAYQIWSAPQNYLLESIQRTSDKVYYEFKQRVALSRKLNFDSLNAIAEGRIWSARDAQNHGLIDKIGSLQDAIIEAANRANLKQYKVTVYPKPKQYWTIFWEQMQNSTKLLEQITSFQSFPNSWEKNIQSIFQPYQILLLLMVNFD